MLARLEKGTDVANACSRLQGDFESMHSSTYGGSLIRLTEICNKGSSDIRHSISMLDQIVFMNLNCSSNVAENSNDLEERSKLRSVLAGILVASIAIGSIIALMIALPFDFLWQDNPPLISLVVPLIAFGAVILAIKLKLI